MGPCDPLHDPQICIGRDNDFQLGRSCTHSVTTSASCLLFLEYQGSNVILHWTFDVTANNETWEAGASRLQMISFEIEVI